MAIIMAIKTINSCTFKDNGKTNEIICPVCGKNVEIRLFENVNSLPISKLLDKERTESFALCPMCASMFKVNENYINERKNGTTCLITASDLTVIKKAKENE